MWNSGQVASNIKPLVLGNSLRAFGLSTGKMTWSLGYKSSPAEDDPKDDGFTDTHFLGVPLSVGGKLYVLNEKNNGPMGDAELRLVCIDPVKMETEYKPRVISIQTLGQVEQQHRITHDMSRRLNAVHLAYGEGILVCPAETRAAGTTIKGYPLESAHWMGARDMATSTEP